MRETQSASPRHRPETRAADAVRALVKGMTRMLESLAPQPHLQPVPVRVRSAKARRD